MENSGEAGNRQWFRGTMAMLDEYGELNLLNAKWRMLLALLVLGPGLAPALAGDTPLSVMSFNAWGGGRNTGQSTKQTLAAIEAAGADIIGLQESRGETDPCGANYCPPHGPSITRELAEALQFHFYEQQADDQALWSNAILSRYPILGPTELGLGVRIDFQGRLLVLFNIHPTDYPYQPYQLLGIPYGAAPFLQDSAAAVRYARRTRGPVLQKLLKDLATAADADLVAICGDFNEPSHLDWTPAAVEAGLQPLAVSWPFSQALEANGFVDTYRAVWPEVAVRPGFTWSPLITPATRDDHADRIDFVLVRGKGVRVSDAAIIGEDSEHADVVVSPWPSDHRAVVARLLIPDPH